MSSCREGHSKKENSDSFASRFYGNTSTLELVVAYEEGAAPYTSFKTDAAWDITEKNIKQILDGKKIFFVSPKEIEGMSSLGILEQNCYSRQNILDLSGQFQNHDNNGLKKTITLLFLDGFYILDGIKKNKTLGLTLEETSTIAIFKPVIESSDSSKQVQILIEQATVIHEIGHVLGLTNNGVKSISEHHDNTHSTHCTNDSCVMFWQNGGEGINQFLQPFILENKLTFFCDDCIADVKAK